MRELERSTEERYGSGFIGDRWGSRRAFLHATLGLAGITALAACGPSAAPSTSGGTGQSGGATPAGGSIGATPASVEGRIASPAPGVPDAYTKAPPPFKSYNGQPGRGGKVNVFTIAYQTPPPPRQQNQYWQELEKRLGVTWEPIITPQPNYGDKSAALIAGGSLPELFYLNPGQNAAPQYKAMEQGAFTDLTPYVTGDALKEYKNLATFPDYMWNNTKFKGKIYGVPKPLQRNGNIGFYRADWATKVGIATPKSPDEVHDLLVAFAKNDPDGNGQADTWGLARYGSGWDGWDDARAANNMLGVPFNWRKTANGTLTHEIETDEFRQALDFLRRLFADGAFHPDAGGMTFAQAQAAFIGGKVGLHSEGIGNFYSPSVAGTVYYKIKQANPQAELTGLMPSGPGGAKAVTRNTQGSFGFTGVPATVGKDKARVQELLRILDYLAAPFGSEEYNFLTYGIEGVDYQVTNGVPVMTDKGTSEKGDLVYVMAGLPVFYFPQTPDVAQTAQQLAYQIIKIGIDDPTWPLYSPTNVTKAPELNQFGFDQVTAIVTGRQPLTALDAAIKEWKSRGGDQIRQEFEQALKGQ
jgi:putative aldouronate transport system substrate-binding protein